MSTHAQEQSALYNTIDQVLTILPQPYIMFLVQVYQFFSSIISF